MKKVTHTMRARLAAQFELALNQRREILAQGYVAERMLQTAKRLSQQQREEFTKRMLTAAHTQTYNRPLPPEPEADYDNLPTL